MSIAAWISVVVLTVGAVGAFIVWFQKVLDAIDSLWKRWTTNTKPWLTKFRKRRPIISFVTLILVGNAIGTVSAVSFWVWLGTLKSSPAVPAGGPQPPKATTDDILGELKSQRARPVRVLYSNQQKIQKAYFPVNDPTYTEVLNVANIATMTPILVADAGSINLVLSESPIPVIANPQTGQSYDIPAPFNLGIQAPGTRNLKFVSSGKEFLFTMKNKTHTVDVCDRIFDVSLLTITDKSNSSTNRHYEYLFGIDEKPAPEVLVSEANRARVEFKESRLTGVVPGGQLLFIATVDNHDRTIAKNLWIRGRAVVAVKHELPDPLPADLEKVPFAACLTGNQSKNFGMYLGTPPADVLKRVIDKISSLYIVGEIGYSDALGNDRLYGYGFRYEVDSKQLTLMTEDGYNYSR